MYLMGVQCSGTVQPVFGRSPLFQQQNGVFQSNSNSQSNNSPLGLQPNDSLGISGPGNSSLIGNGSATFHHLNGSTIGSNSSINASSPVHLHQLNGLSHGTNSNNHRENSNGKHHLHNSSIMRNGSLNNSINQNNSNNSLAPALLDYFPNAGNDGLNIVWYDGVNSRARLNHVLSSDVSMIQADVTLAENSRYPIPIMAQPPLNMSDLTLEDFLLQLIHSESGKGLKLDFKTTRVVEPAFRVLARHADYIKAPLILNADILAGENKQRAQPVDAWTFLMLCRTRFPKSIISMGWCIDVNKTTLETGYSRSMVDQMLGIVKEYSLLQPITFPVNAALLKIKSSITELQRLLFQVPNSSLTLFAQPGDPVTIEDLYLYRKAFLSRIELWQTLNTPGFQKPVKKTPSK